MSNPSPVFKADNTAVITGGASGIGLALATKCVSYGMNVVLVDNNSQNLNEAKTSLEGKGEGKVEIVEADVGKVEEFGKVVKVVEGEFGGKIDILALNAGIGLKGGWEDTDYFHRIFDVNLFGVIHGLNTLLPLVTSHSTASSPSSIIITGSKQGITNPPGNPAYNASKAAVKTITEHLSFDLSKSSPTTSVHLLIPGWTFTGMTGGGGMKEKPAGAWSPEQVVEYLEEKMAEGRFYVLCPDNDVDERKDKVRVQWAAGDIVSGRPPLSRWREDYAVEAEEWMKKRIWRMELASARNKKPGDAEAEESSKEGEGEEA